MQVPVPQRSLYSVSGRVLSQIMEQSTLSLRTGFTAVFGELHAYTQFCSLRAMTKVFNHNKATC